MPTKSRSASQARKDRAALKRLQKSGIYRGKVDLRKKPTKRQQELIKELGSRKSKSKNQPMPPRSKTPGANVKRTRMSEKETRNAQEGNKLTTYALPFLRKGKAEPEWRRFTLKGLRQFLAEYKAGDEEGAAEWRSYAVRETWTFKTKTEKSGFRADADLYFSGRRINAPQGGAQYQRKTKGHSKAGTKRAGRASSKRGKK